MKQLRPLNRSARACLARGERDVTAQNATECCPSFAPGWEIGAGARLDPCPWISDLQLCYVTCYWTGQTPDEETEPHWLSSCANISQDWRSLCVIPD